VTKGGSARVGLLIAAMRPSLTTSRPTSLRTSLQSAIRQWHMLLDSGTTVLLSLLQHCISLLALAPPEEPPVARRRLQLSLAMLAAKPLVSHFSFTYQSFFSISKEK